MDFEIFFSTDEGKDQAKIANAVRNGSFSDSDFETLISKLKERKYFQETDFKKDENKKHWNLDYANKLCLNCLLYFSESYLRHLREVSNYVNNKISKVKYSGLKFVVAGIIILALILVLFFSNK